MKKLDAVFGGQRVGIGLETLISNKRREQSGVSEGGSGGFCRRCLNLEHSWLSLKWHGAILACFPNSKPKNEHRRHVARESFTRMPSALNMRDSLGTS